MSSPTPADRRAWHEQQLGYTETYGDPDLRTAIAATYQHVDPADVLCFAGAEEGIYLAIQVLLGRDDHAVVSRPTTSRPRPCRCRSARSAGWRWTRPATGHWTWRRYGRRPGRRPGRTYRPVPVGLGRLGTEAALDDFAAWLHHHHHT